MRNLIIYIFVVFHAGTAHAKITQWEEPLQVLLTSISGPVAHTLVVLGIIGGFAGYIFRAEMSDTIKTMLNVVCVGGVILGATGVVGNLFDVSSTAAGMLL